MLQCLRQLLTIAFAGQNHGQNREPTGIKGFSENVLLLATTGHPFQVLTGHGVGRFASMRLTDTISGTWL